MAEVYTDLDRVRVWLKGEGPIKAEGTLLLMEGVFQTQNGDDTLHVDGTEQAPTQKTHDLCSAPHSVSTENVVFVNVY